MYGEIQMLEKIFKENNKTYWQKIAREIIDKNQLRAFLPLFLHKDKRIAQRASAYFMTIVTINPEVFLPFQEEILIFLQQNPNIPQRRNIMRWLQFVAVEETLQAIVLDKSLEYLENPLEEIATKCYCMQIVYQFVKKYPELKEILTTLIELNIEQKSSAAIKSRAAMILKKL